jgi:hypothetical protein
MNVLHQPVECPHILMRSTSPRVLPSYGKQHGSGEL